MSIRQEQTLILCDKHPERSATHLSLGRCKGICKECSDAGEGGALVTIVDIDKFRSRWESLEELMKKTYLLELNDNVYWNDTAPMLGSKFIELIKNAFQYARKG